ncbi:uncharacterized protein TM35_000531120, partial [Trypanosoma theileri]
MCRNLFSVVLLLSIACAGVVTDVSATTGQAAREEGEAGVPGTKGSCPSAGEGSDANCPSESAETSCSPDANDGRTCPQPEVEKRNTNVPGAAAGLPPPAPHDPQGERSLPGQVSVVSSSSGLD